MFLGRVIARLFIDSEICLKILDWDLILSVYVSAQHNWRPHRTGRFENKDFSLNLVKLNRNRLVENVRPKLFD